MTAETYLKKLDNLQSLINSKRLLYDEQLAICTQVNKEFDQIRVKTSRDLRRQEEENVKLAMIGEEIDKLTALPDEARVLFDQLEDNRYSAILTSRHLAGLKWSEVKEIVGYEKSWTHELYIRAVDALDELLKDRTLPDTFV
ncbi:MAG: hypothetical protein GX924_07080 [Clostridiaceae bacterium]|nr:hypothetical protein [Clostridiaceae bacterium]